jgi:hypothetical protein
MGEVGVARAQHGAVLRNQRSDPQVVGRDGCTLLAELPVQAGELKGSFLVGEQ